MIAFISLVILFVWLNFVLTQQIESTGRDIQVRTKQLGAQERRNETLLRQISEAGSGRELAQRAKSLGYRPVMPIYLTIDEPIIGEAEDASVTGGLFTSLTTEELEAQQFDPFWDLLGQQTNPARTEAAP